MALTEEIVQDKFEIVATVIRKKSARCMTSGGKFLLLEKRPDTEEEWSHRR